VKYALAGILGAAIAGRLAKSLIGAFAKDAPHILDDVNPRVPGFTTIPETRVKLPVSGDMTVGKLISMGPEEVMTSSDLQHAKHIEVQSVQQVFDLAKAIKGGEAVPNGDLKQAIAITRSVSAALEGTRENFSNLGRGIEGRVRAANRHIDRPRARVGPEHAGTSSRGYSNVVSKKGTNLFVLSSVVLCNTGSDRTGDVWSNIKWKGD